jgi:hypothetical protein
LDYIRGGFISTPLFFKAPANIIKLKCGNSGKMYLIYSVLYNKKTPIAIEIAPQRKKHDRNKTLADFLSVKNK